MEASALIAIISVSATALGGFLTSLFHSISLSRCSEISCCGCMCKRQVLSEEAYLNESKKSSHNVEPISPRISPTNIIN